MMERPELSPGATAEQPKVDDEALEREALGKVVLAFRKYAEHAEFEVARWEWNFRNLPPHHQALLASSQHTKFTTARQCIHNNQFFINSMLAAFDPEENEEEDGGAPSRAPPSMLAGANAAGDEVAKRKLAPQGGDMEKVRYVLRNLVRDWSAEGEAERQASYGRIIAELRRLYAGWDAASPERPRVLVPGAGLARLVCELAGAGYEAQGNEFAYFMLITSAFVLNAISEREQYTIFPWVTGSCNNVEDSHQLRGVPVPDVCPLEIVRRSPHTGLLSMAAGDFVEIYGAAEQRGAWDAVATCFFIDTAHNVVQYLEVLAHCIKPGGYWINLGPLLFHWADGYGMSELSLELSLAEIKRVAQALGFSMVQDQMVEAPYMANPTSMYKTTYTASFFTMQKMGLHLPTAAREAVQGSRG